MLPVPDHLTDIELIVADAGTAAPVSIDRGWGPLAAFGPWHTLTVERMRNGFWRFASIIIFKNPADNVGFVFDYISVSAAFTII